MTKDHIELSLNQSFSASPKLFKFQILAVEKKIILMQLTTKLSLLILKTVWGQVSQFIKFENTKMVRKNIPMIAMVFFQQ